MFTHGGKRPGAGRKPGPEPSKTVRIPLSRVEEIKTYLAQPRIRAWGNVEYLGEPDRMRTLALPLFDGSVPAGFPSPAEDYAEGRLDLNDYLVEHEAATFYVRVKGHSMSGAGILDGDIIAVDRALEPHAETIRLLPRNPDFAPIELKPGQELTIWGVVKGVVRKLR